MRTLWKIVCDYFAPLTFLIQRQRKTPKPEFMELAVEISKGIGADYELNVIGMVAAKRNEDGKFLVRIALLQNLGPNVGIEIVGDSIVALLTTWLEDQGYPIEDEAQQDNSTTPPFSEN